jgi:hypothetical protein
MIDAGRTDVPGSKRVSSIELLLYNTDGSEVLLFLVPPSTAIVSTFVHSFIALPFYLGPSREQANRASGIAESKPVYSDSRKRKTTATNSRAVDGDDVKPGTGHRKKRKVTTVKAADSSDLSSLAGSE